MHVHRHRLITHVLSNHWMVLCKIDIFLLSHLLEFGWLHVGVFIRMRFCAKKKARGSWKLSGMHIQLAIEHNVIGHRINMGTWCHRYLIRSWRNCEYKRNVFCRIFVFANITVHIFELLCFWTFVAYVLLLCNRTTIQVILIPQMAKIRLHMCFIEFIIWCNNCWLIIQWTTKTQLLANRDIVICCPLRR